MTAHAHDNSPVVLINVFKCNAPHLDELMERLGDLVRRILKLTQVPRLRISSIDSIEADPALIEAIATEPRLMPHLQNQPCERRYSQFGARSIIGIIRGVSLWDIISCKIVTSR